MGLDLREKGVPEVDQRTCTACGRCVAACPDAVLEWKDGKPWAGSGVFLGCIACGHCVAACPTGGITVRGRGMTAADAVELPPRNAFASADQFEALLLARRSIRRFTKQEVDQASLDSIVRVTSTAPMGIPPHDVGVVVFHGLDRVQAFADDVCKAFERMKWFFSPWLLGLMRPFIGKENYAIMREFVKPLVEMLIRKRAEGEDWFAYNAPAAMLFHYGPMSGAADCHIATTYAMLAAESLGLGSCMLGTTEGLNSSKWFKAKYRIPPRNKIGLGLVLGHPATDFRRGVRRRLASVQFA